MTLTAWLLLAAVLVLDTVSHLLLKAASLRAEGATLPEPRTFTRNEMAGWIEDDEADMRRLREQP